MKFWKLASKKRAPSSTSRTIYTCVFLLDFLHTSPMNFPPACGAKKFCIAFFHRGKKNFFTSREKKEEEYKLVTVFNTFERKKKLKSHQLIFLLTLAASFKQSRKVLGNCMCRIGWIQRRFQGRTKGNWRDASGGGKTEGNSRQNWSFVTSSAHESQRKFLRVECIKYFAKQFDSRAEHHRTDNARWRRWGDCKTSENLQQVHSHRHTTKHRGEKYSRHSSHAFHLQQTRNRGWKWNSEDSHAKHQKSLLDLGQRNTSAAPWLPGVPAPKQL